MLDLKKVLSKVLYRLDNLESAISNVLSNYYTKTETNGLLNNKQNKITLSTEEPQNSQGVDGDIWIVYEE